MTLRRIFRRSSAAAGSIIHLQGEYINTWETVNLGALDEGQEVESDNRTRKEKVS